MKIGITGNTGFIGKNLNKALRKKNNITVKIFDKKKYSLESQEDLYTFVSHVDVIIHLAGITDKMNSQIFAVNTMGTLHLLEAVKKINPTCTIIFASTFAIYKLPRKNELVTESFQIDPENVYGLSKYFAEQSFLFYANAYGIRSIILRFSNIYGSGPNNHSVITRFIEEQKNNTIIIDNDGEQTRDFIHIDDVISALLATLSLQLKEKCTIINIVSGEEVSINTVVSMMESFLEKRIKKAYKKTDKKNSYWNCSNKKAREILSWEPRVPFKDGLRRTLHIGL